jgi:hypothetical protein
MAWFALLSQESRKYLKSHKRCFIAACARLDLCPKKGYNGLFTPLEPRKRLVRAFLLKSLGFFGLRWKKSTNAREQVNLKWFLNGLSPCIYSVHVFLSFLVSEPLTPHQYPATIITDGQNNKQKRSPQWLRHGYSFTLFSLLLFCLVLWTCSITFQHHSNIGGVIVLKWCCKIGGDLHTPTTVQVNSDKIKHNKNKDLKLHFIFASQRLCKRVLGIQWTIVTP